MSARDKRSGIGRESASRNPSHDRAGVGPSRRLHHPPEALVDRVNRLSLRKDWETVILDRLDVLQRRFAGADPECTASRNESQHARSREELVQQIVGLVKAMSAFDRLHLDRTDSRAAVGYPALLAFLRRHTGERETDIQSNLELATPRFSFCEESTHWARDALDEVEQELDQRSSRDCAEEELRELDDLLPHKESFFEPPSPKQLQARDRLLGIRCRRS